MKYYFNINDSHENNENNANYKMIFKKLISADMKSLSDKDRIALKDGSYLIESFLGIAFSKKWKELDAKSKYDKTENELILLFKAIAGTNPSVFIFECLCSLASLVLPWVSHSLF